MKLLIGGSTGFVGTELVRQALKNPKITSIVGLGRRETVLPPSTPGAEKLKSVVCNNFDEYPESVKNELHDVDACIWTIAVTPMNMKSLPWSETVKITRDWTSTSLETLGKIPRKQSQPLRYIYMSGHFAPRERTEAPKVLSDNNLMEAGYLRVRLHHELLPDLVPRPTNIFLRIAKSGFILTPGKVAPPVPGLPSIQLEDISAALLDQAVEGLEKDTLFSEDMTRIGQNALGKTAQ
ncbi:putative nucleoside-diphosphate-sugar epimerase [Diaporthe ampelina]|uniref:Putative nucleoside-diphosphate-sugar epimerase n=1 Tax=Diaporthe ampelina TaxID=1214573 RepID=A0A0G2HYU2_9PEZI|nr:putative nucleoside-diphosphate-sugar epimerase [Diaporthe ampelina]